VALRCRHLVSRLPAAHAAARSLPATRRLRQFRAVVRIPPCKGTRQVCRTLNRSAETYAARRYHVHINVRKGWDRETGQTPDRCFSLSCTLFCCYCCLFFLNSVLMIHVIVLRWTALMHGQYLFRQPAIVLFDVNLLCSLLGK